MTALLISALAIIITVSLYLKQPVQLFLRVAAIVLVYVLATNISLSINTTVPQNDHNRIVIDLFNGLML